MRLAAVLLLAALCLAEAPAIAQERGWRGSRAQQQELAPRGRESRADQGRERAERRGERRERRFTAQEREKLRQDLLDANREMRGRRK